MNKKITGDEKSFRKAWRTSKESLYNHWTAGAVKNQVQFAFRNHFEVFRELIGPRRGRSSRRFLEVGCGRGSLSSYFAAAGWDCTLLDVSPEVIAIARKIFKKNGQRAKFVVGDATRLPFEDGSFEAVASIGLFEHFEQIQKPISEQVRVLAPGGVFLGYIVPKYHDSLQKDYDWINEILKGYATDQGGVPSKQKVYRSDRPSAPYLKAMKKLGLRRLGASGIYSLPMISHSIEFPFTLMPPRAEAALVKHFQEIFARRREKSRHHPWLCREGEGQAFLVWGENKSKVRGHKSEVQVKSG